MSRNRTLGILAWAIAFAFSVFLMLILSSQYSHSVLTTLVFDVIAYISVLILWIGQFRSAKSLTETFYCFPAMTISLIYLGIQLILCIAVGLLADIISFKLTLILNVITTALAWFLILSTTITKNYAKQVDSRQKNHHIEL